MEDMKNLAELVEAQIRKNGNRLFSQNKDGWSWKQTTWLDFKKETRDLAAFLLGLEFGSGEKAMVFYPNTREALWSEVAISLLGGTVVSMSERDALDGIEEVARAQNVGFMLGGGDEFLGRAKGILKRLPTVKRIIAFGDAKVGEEGGEVIPFKAALRFGAIKRRGLDDEIDKRAAGIEPDTAAAIFVDAGNPGSLVVTEHTHADVISVVRSLSGRLSFLSEEDQSFSFLPSPCPFSRFINYAGMEIGLRIMQAESWGGFFQDVLEVKPTVIFETAEALEEIHNAITREHGGHALKRALGGRLRSVVTDRKPSAVVESAFSEERIAVLEVGGLLLG